MGRTLTKRTLHRAALALASMVGAGAAPFLPTTTQAQDLPLPGEGFTWERVGDRPIDVFDISFGPDGTLWATADDGPHRLDLSNGFPGAWVLLKDYAVLNGVILPLGRGPDGDTLVATSGADTRRSTDAGRTWVVVYDEGDSGLYEVPAGLPHAGRLLTGDRRNVAYSDDRGATWTASVVATLGEQPSGGEDFVALPEDSSYPGRILTVGPYGASLSDDGGATFRPSALWLAGHHGTALALAERPGAVRGGGHNALMGGWVSLGPDHRAWVSEDEGETWGPGTGGVHLPEGPPEGIGFGQVAMASLGGPSALAVLGRGTVYRTDDAGQTWAAVGRAPDIDDAIHVLAAALGPDGRLYVGLHEAGSAQAWVYRTGEVVTASEPNLEPPGEEPLRVAVHPNPAHDSATVAFTLRTPSEVEAVLYDGLGRRVAVLAAGAYGAGRHTVALDGAALPAGVYVVYVAARSGAGAPAVAARRVTITR
jgi:photosystem II stability/assembly factor-like uncharacterized protein